MLGRIRVTLNVHSVAAENKKIGSFTLKLCISDQFPIITGGKRMVVTKSYDHPEMGDNSRDKFFFSDFRAVKGSFESNRLSHIHIS